VHASVTILPSVSPARTAAADLARWAGSPRAVDGRPTTRDLMPAVMAAPDEGGEVVFLGPASARGHAPEGATVRTVERRGHSLRYVVAVLY